MAPPKLAGDAPVLDVTHPGEVHVFVLLGHELDTAVFHRFDGWLCQGFGVGEPLVGEHGLDDQARAVAPWHAQHVVFDFLYQAFGVHIRHDLLTGLFAGKAGVRSRQAAVHIGVFSAIGVDHFGYIADAGVLGHDVDHYQVVALAHGVVVKVVGGGDLDAATAFFRVGVGVGENGNASAYQREVNEFANQVLVALIVRVHGHGGIAQHRFRTGGGDHEIALAILRLFAVGQRIAKVPEKAFLFLVLDLEVGNGGVQLRVPVDQALATVNQAFVVQADKHFLHGFVETVVHCETFVVPVH